MQDRHLVCRVVWTTAALVASAGLSSSANAGGLEFPDLGTVAIGRGTAFVARADNSSAFYYNPAGLSKQPRGNALLSANFVHMRVEYQRKGSDACLHPSPGGACAGGYDPALDYSQTRRIGANGLPIDDPAATRSFQPVSMSGVSPAPMLAGSFTGIGRAGGLSIGLGVVPSSSFGGPKYPSDGAQRYMVQHSDILSMFPGVALAYNVNRYFQIGATFLSGATFMSVNRAARLSVDADDPQRRNEDAAGDAGLTLRGKDWFMPTGIVGVLSNPTDWLEIGASVKFPTKLEARGTVELQAPELDEPNAAITGDDTVILRQSSPWVVRVGGRYIHQYFDFEVDFVYESWSQMEQLEVDFVDCRPGGGACTQVQTSSGPVALQDMIIPKNYRDTYSVRAGGDFALWPGHLMGRVGGYYQTSSLPKNHDTMNLDAPFGGELIGVGGGMTWNAVQYLDVTVGFMHVFQRTVEVTQGIVQQASNPIAGPDDDSVQPGNVVNNGTYEVALNLFGASFQGHF